MPKNPSTEEPASIFPDDLKEYMDRNREGGYLLLDVRQPEEYAQSHLPGARLTPLPLLADSLGELEKDRDKDTIVYCALGGRSRAAARFLAERGFSRVRHLVGGIEAWEQKTATGPVDLQFEFIRGDESPAEAALLAWRMEDGLKLFHLAMREKSSDPDLRRLLETLAGAEEGHKRRLAEYLEETGEVLPPAPTGAAKIVEGGMDMERFLRENEPLLGSVAGYLDLAMSLETQALDLYLRMAYASRNQAALEVFLRIGDEEKQHLTKLGEFLAGTL